MYIYIYYLFPNILKYKSSIKHSVHFCFIFYAQCCP